MRRSRSSERSAPTRVGVVGEVHACDERLCVLLDHFREGESVDAVWCVGDIVNGPGDPGVRALLCHGLGENDMNNVTADGYGYSLEANDELQTLLRRGPLLVVKGHRHRPAIWRLRDLTLVDTGTLLSPDAPYAVVIDASARTLTPLRFSEAGVTADPAQPF